MATRIITGLIIIICGLAFVIWQQDQALELERKTNYGLREYINSGTIVHKAPTGESLASQPKAEVSKATFNEVKGAEIKAMEKRLGQRLGKVENLIEASLNTETTNKVPVRDTLIIRDTVKVEAKVAKWSGKFESGLILIEGDSALVQTQVRNRLAVLETRDRWKLKHLWPGNWGTRKKRVNLLVYNPGTRIDTLTNLSVIQ